MNLYQARQIVIEVVALTHIKCVNNEVSAMFKCGTSISHRL